MESIDKYIDSELKLWKKDNHGNITLNLSTVRQLHGRNTIKRLYKIRGQITNAGAIYKLKSKRKKHFNDEKANTLF